MDRARVRDRPEHVDRRRVNAGAHVADLVRGEAALVHAPQERVGGRVGVAAGGVKLERGLQHGPPLPETLRELLGVGVGGHPRPHALRPFQNAARPREAVPGEVGGEQPVGCCFGRVELLGVGGVAQELPEPGRLSTRGAQGVQHRFFVGLQEVGDRRRRGDRARRAGGVEDLVVAPSQKGTDPDPGLIAGHAGRDEVSSRGAGLLRRGQGGGEHYGRGVEDRPVVHVVLLDDVRGGGVD